VLERHQFLAVTQQHATQIGIRDDCKGGGRKDVSCTRKYVPIKANVAPLQRPVITARPSSSISARSLSATGPSNVLISLNISLPSPTPRMSRPPDGWSRVTGSRVIPRKAPEQWGDERTDTDSFGHQRHYSERDPRIRDGIQSSHLDMVPYKATLRTCILRFECELAEYARITILTKIW
jgi:hypothetical protein